MFDRYTETVLTNIGINIICMSPLGWPCLPPPSCPVGLACSSGT